LFLSFCLCACSSSTAAGTPGVALDSAADDTSVAEAAVDAAPDTAPFPVHRLPCVQRSGFARDLPPDTYGMIEADLVTVIMPGNRDCPSDSDHVHLQIAIGDKRYDVAMTVDSTTNAPLAIHLQTIAPRLADVGFAMGSFDYETDLGTPSADFTALAKDALASKIADALKDAGRIRIYGQTYTDGTGIHFVHRNGRNRDGVLIVHRVEMGSDRAVALRFANDVF
jgi:hypothetical protein